MRLAHKPMCTDSSPERQQLPLELDSNPRKPSKPKSPFHQPISGIYSDPPKSTPQTTPLLRVRRIEDFGHIDIDTMRRLAHWLDVRNQNPLQGSTQCQTKTTDLSLPPAISQTQVVTSDACLATELGRSVTPTNTEDGWPLKPA